MSIRLGNYGSSRVYSAITQEVYHSKLNFQHIRRCEYVISAWQFKNWAKCPDDVHKAVARCFWKYRIHLLSKGYENL